MRPFVMLNMLRYNLLLLLLMGLCWSFQASDASAETTAEWRASVAQQQYLIWQRINEARSNPLKVLRRLEIPLEQAQAAFGESSDILTEGLPPLAWSSQLGQAAKQHARDMIDHVYYSHTSKDGSGPMERIAATGYQAVAEDETLGALLFLNPVELEFGVSALLDNILRAELTGTVMSRNVFSRDFTEVAVSFDAEILPTLVDQPFAYIVVVDFAKPQVPRRYMLGQFDVGDRIMMKPFGDELWISLSNQLPGLFQVAYPVGGASFVVINDESMLISDMIKFYDKDFLNNDLIDLRTK